MADEIDSPFVVTSTASAGPAITNSRDVGRETSFFQGPGESPDINGDGKGVTSAIALSIGDDKAEFGADPMFEFDPRLFANTCFMLGALEGIGIVFDARTAVSPDLRLEDSVFSTGEVTE